MLYEYTLTVPANTAEADAVSQDLKLTKGVIHRVEVDFPIGTRGLVHVKIFRGANQVWPDNPDGDIATDGHPRAWDEHYEVSDQPTTFTAKGWSTADTYDYDIRIAIGMLPKEVMSPLSGVVGALKKVLRFLGGKE